MDPFAARYHNPKWCFADRITIRQRSATVRREVIFGPRDHIKKPADHTRKNLVKGSPAGFIARDAAKRIRHIITDWTQAVNCGSSWSKREGVEHGIYFSFCTLTLPVKQMHDDKVLKQDLLNPFIKALQRDHGVTNYLWRAEPQRNGNIHFHLFLDRFIEFDLIAKYWDYHLEFLGYITAYYEQSGSLFPPATQIVKVPKDGQLREYIAKYLSKAQAKRRSILPADLSDLDLPKSERAPKVTRISYWATGEDKQGVSYEYEVRAILGRVWGCSDRLRNLKPFNVLVSDITGKWINMLAKTQAAYVTAKEYITILTGSLTESLKGWDQWTWRAFYWWHVDQFRHLYCDQEELPPKQPESIREILLSCCAGVRKMYDLSTEQAPVDNPSGSLAPQFIKPRSLEPLLTIPF
jgi:hypothetical protein